MQYSATHSDFEYLENSVGAKDLYGSDSSLANLFLLQPKYDIQLFVHKGILLRKYNGHNTRNGWGFPIALKSAEENFLQEGLRSAIEFILEKSEDEGESVCFCLCTQEQKKQIDECLARFFSSHALRWDTDRADSDYLYLTQNLADLPGSNYQKKRNHISRFNRIYGDGWQFKLFPENNIGEDILLVADRWFEEKNGWEDQALVLENESIHVAVENASLLRLRGGVVYINGEPAAMTLASPVSDTVLDVHFEKALALHEPNGVYAVINNQFAKTCSDFIYLNREEDMGVEGLRKAKLSYKPTIILDKFYGVAY